MGNLLGNSVSSGSKDEKQNSIIENKPIMVAAAMGMAGALGGEEGMKMARIYPIQLEEKVKIDTKVAKDMEQRFGF